MLAGEETEVDKTMIEDLADPLIHLIRNAVGHGVEGKGRRAACRRQTLESRWCALEARQGSVITSCLIVADDGRGMSAERIAPKAIERG